MSTCSLASLELIQDLAPDRIDRGVGSLSRAAPNWQRGSAYSSHDDDADLSWKREEKEKHVTSRYSSSPLLFFFAWVRNRHREMQCVFQRHDPFVASILHLNGVHLGHAETAELRKMLAARSCKAVNSRGFHWRLSAGVHFLANLSWNCHSMGKIWENQISLLFRDGCREGNKYEEDQECLTKWSANTLLMTIILWSSLDNIFQVSLQNRHLSMHDSRLQRRLLRCGPMQHATSTFVF